MSLGPVMLDLEGPQLLAEEREILAHPLVGGVILFTRNYVDIEQLENLVREIRELRQPSLLVAVDHEGGRVQRFRDGFTRLPPCSCYGELYNEEALEGNTTAENAGWLMAMELLCVGIDFSFAPVLDVDIGLSQVIGDRAFHKRPEVVVELAGSFCQGMRRAGMVAIGKHFPGHGGVKEDSHHAVPVDDRRFQDLVVKDMLPFERLINSHLQGVMPAHVIYSNVDERPAGFSTHWLSNILRGQLGFQGTIFSDDISMAGAEVLGSYEDRAMAALDAGCDMVLVCNNQKAAVSLLQSLPVEANPASQVRLIRMHGRLPEFGLRELQQDAEWIKISRQMSQLDKSPELGL